MGDDKLIKKVNELLTNSTKEDVRPLVLGCFKDNGYNFERCKCCIGYESKCNLVLDSLFRSIYGNNSNRIV